MNKDNLFRLQDYRSYPEKDESDLSDFTDYGEVTKRIDTLEERLTGKIDILVSKNSIPADKKRSISLAISAFISGVAFVLMLLSTRGVVDIGWQFWAAIFFASSGLAFASLLILIGVDHDEYDES